MFKIVPKTPMKIWGSQIVKVKIRQVWLLEPLIRDCFACPNPNWTLYCKCCVVCLQSKTSGGCRLGLVFWVRGRVDRVMIGSFSASASWFHWGAPSSSSGASSSCSSKVPVFRQPMKGAWKLSITRLPSRPHPWESFSLSPFFFLFLTWPQRVYPPIDPAVHASGILLELPSMCIWHFLCSFLVIGNKDLDLKEDYTSFELDFSNKTSQFHFQSVLRFIITLHRL